MSGYRKWEDVKRDMFLWESMDLTEAIEQCYVASELIQIFDMAAGRSFLLKPTGINTEGMPRYEL